MLMDARLTPVTKPFPFWVRSVSSRVHSIQNNNAERVIDHMRALIREMVALAGVTSVIAESSAAAREAALAMLAGRAAAASRWAQTRPMMYNSSLRICASGVTPHIAIDGDLSRTGTPRATAMNRQTTRQGGCAISQRCRMRSEKVCG